MHLIQILLPVRDNNGDPQPHDLLTAVRHELTARFGGLTAFTRSPAEGTWNGAGETTFDDIVVIEVMADTVDRAWWVAYRSSLEERFRQKAVIVRSSLIDLL